MLAWLKIFASQTGLSCNNLKKSQEGESEEKYWSHLPVPLGLWSFWRIFPDVQLCKMFSRTGISRKQSWKDFLGKPLCCWYCGSSAILLIRGNRKYPFPSEIIDSACSQEITQSHSDPKFRKTLGKREKTEPWRSSLFQESKSHALVTSLGELCTCPVL